MQILHRLTLRDLFVEFVQFLIRLPRINPVDIIFRIFEARILLGHRFVDGPDHLPFVRRPDVERRQDAGEVEDRFEPEIVDGRLILIDMEAGKITVAGPYIVRLEAESALRLNRLDECRIVAVLLFDCFRVLLS